MSEQKSEVTRFPVTGQPVFRLVDLFLERTSYTRRWNLPFDMCSLCLEEDPSDPSWAELPETGEHYVLAKDVISFTTCSTPMILHYAPHQLHFCIHFTYEILPGFIAGMVAAIAVSLLTEAPSKEVTDLFDRFKATKSLEEGDVAENEQI